MERDSHDNDVPCIELHFHAHTTAISDYVNDALIVVMKFHSLPLCLLFTLAFSSTKSENIEME